MEWNLVIRESGFVKLYITANKECMGVQIIKYATFLAMRVANKNATFGTSAKFVFEIDNSAIIEVTKNAQVSE